MARLLQNLAESDFACPPMARKWWFQKIEACMNHLVHGDLLSCYRKAAVAARQKEQLERVVAAKAVRRRKVLEAQLEHGAYGALKYGV